MSYTVSSEATIGAVWYRDIEALTDAVYTSRFPEEDTLTDAELKYGEVAPVIASLDMRWLLKKHPNQPTDPRERTHLYLQKLALVAQEVLETEGEVRFDRHALHHYFPDGEFIGTPFSYTDIDIAAATKNYNNSGVLLTGIGGGYAGNNLPETEDNDRHKKILSGFEVFIDALDPNAEKHTLPIKKLARVAMNAALELGVVFPEDRDTLEAVYAELYTPRSVYDHRDGRVTYFSSPATEGFLAASRIGFGRPGRPDFKVLGARYIPDSRAKLDSGDISQGVHPLHAADAEGNVTYGAVDMDHQDLREPKRLIKIGYKLNEAATGFEANDRIAAVLQETTEEVRSIIAGQ